MVEITRSQLEHKLSEYNEKNKFSERIMNSGSKILLYVVVIEVALSLILLKGINLLSLIAAIGLPIITFFLFVTIIFVVSFVSLYRHEFKGVQSTGEALKSLLFQIKYKNISKAWLDYTDNNMIISEVDSALKKEKNTFYIAMLMRIKMEAFLRENDFNNARKIFDEICADKRFSEKTVMFAEIMYYSVTEMKNEYIAAYEKYSDYMKQLSRSSLNNALVLVTYNILYMSLNENYEKALELTQLHIEYMRRSKESENQKNLTQDYLFSLCAAYSSLAQIYVRLGQYENARNTLGRIDEITSSSDKFIMHPLLAKEIAETRETLSKINDDID